MDTSSQVKSSQVNRHRVTSNTISFALVVCSTVGRTNAIVSEDIEPGKEVQVPRSTSVCVNGIAAGTEELSTLLLPFF